jgi:exo-beta-1,3-glucanase (GH17 family)
MRANGVSSKDRRDRADRFIKAYQKFTEFRTPLALLLISMSLIGTVWCWLATPVAPSPINSTTKVDCVSYAPFRDHQSPWNSQIIVSPDQIAADLNQLAKMTGCIRTYSVENGLDKVPELASKVGLKVLLGVWIGRDRLKNSQLIKTALSLVKDNPGVITAIIVGSEVMLRGEMSESDLRETIRSVKARVDIPVTYADVWEFWLRHQDLAVDVDFVTIHILPYWEDLPVRAENAAAHADAILRRMALAFPGKEVLIGEAGWPSQGRMREGALPSRINQAHFISEILDRASKGHFRVNLFEAYDEPWKRQWEGTVGSSWGLFDGWSRELKYPPGTVVSNYPFWKLQLGSGIALSICVFGAALAALRRRPSMPRLTSWVAVAISATVSGILLGVNAEKALYESYGFGNWLVQGLLLATGLAAPLLCSSALICERTIPALWELVGPREGRCRSLPMLILGGTLAVITLIALQTALGLVFDPRWRDFPYAGLTMAVVPFWTLTLLNPSDSDARPVAEAVFAAVLAGSAFYILFNEGPENWQSLWTAAAYLLLGATLRPVRFAAVANWVLRPSVFSSSVRMLGPEGSGLRPVDVAVVLTPNSLAKKAIEGAATIGAKGE